MEVAFFKCPVRESNSQARMRGIGAPDDFVLNNFHNLVSVSGNKTKIYTEMEDQTINEGGVGIVGNYTKVVHGKLSFVLFYFSSANLRTYSLR